MRFNSSQHLLQWQENGTFPGIHRPMLEAIRWAGTGTRYLDLGACHGLLGAAVAMFPPAYVIGIEASREAIGLAQLAGVPVQIIAMRIDTGKLPDLAGIIKRHRIDTVIARRVLPELWGHDLPGGREFARTLHGAGIKQVFVEGRRASPQARNPLDCIDREVAIMAPWFIEAGRPAGNDQIAVLARA